MAELTMHRGPSVDFGGHNQWHVKIMRTLRYRTLVEIVLNVVLRAVPTAVTAVMITTAIKAAIRPYSIAVAPDSSSRNLRKIIIDPASKSRSN